MNDMLQHRQLPGHHVPGLLGRSHRPFSRSSVSGAEAPLPLEVAISLMVIRRGNDPLGLRSY